MPLVLLRVDERLIHGQVVVGWGERLRPQRIVVADDALAASTWEQDLYGLGLSSGTVAEFLPIVDARSRLQQWRTGAERVILLLRNVDALRRLAEGGALADAEVNLGGVHHAPGRKQMLPYLFLSAEEEAMLQAVARTGARISANDLPGSRPVPLDDLTPDT